MRDWYRKKSRDERREHVSKRDPERVRAQDRARHHEKKGDPQYDRRRRAVMMVNNAIRDGRMARRACACGAEGQAHHDNYDRPFDVRWLCTDCHAVEHNPASAPVRPTPVGG